VLPEDDSEEHEDDEDPSCREPCGVGGCIRADLIDHRERSSRDGVVSCERFSVDIVGTHERRP
jgi:hypothetical protein